VAARSAGFQTCCIADFQVDRVLENARPAGLETRDTADLEVCATVAVPQGAPQVERVLKIDLQLFLKWLQLPRLLDNLSFRGMENLQVNVVQ
jgi:hypothetical protein